MKKRPTGMFAFTLVWIGQLISLMGTNMTGFGLTIWAYEKTSSATVLSLMGFFFVAPMLAFSPIAGAIVDRSNRKLMMILPDLAAVIVTLFILLLFISGKLEIWHLYVAVVIEGIFQGFQWPAYSAAIATMLPKEQYGRANGMMSLVETAPGIFAPLAAGALLGIIGLQGILLIDVVTFVFAISTLLMVVIPQPRRTEEGQRGRGNLLREAAFGFHFILERPSLLGLQLLFMVGNFFISIPMAVMAAMILARSNHNEISLGAVNTAGAIGGVVGGIVMSVWGGPKRRVHGVLAGWFFSGMAGSLLMGLGGGLTLWIIAAFIGQFIGPFVNGSNQAIWQSKVAPDLQGRVFSIRRLIAWFVSPLAMLIAGPMADFWLEPAMKAGGSLAGKLGWLVGEGPGSGMALMFVVFGFLAGMVGLAGYAFRSVRDAETILPDYVMTADEPAASS